MRKQQQRDKDRADRQAAYASAWWLKSELYQRLRFGHGYEKVPWEPDHEWQHWKKRDT